MKTILIPVFDGMIARNLLRTDVLKTLVAGGARVVIVPPKGKAEYYKKEFGKEGSVIIDETPAWRHDRTEFFFTGLFLHSIPTRFMRIRQIDWYWHEKKYLMYCCVSILRLIGHIKPWRRFLRIVSDLEPIQPYVKEMFERWNPDVVFAPTMIARDEVALMRLAKKRSKVTIGMVKSWDNLTSKAFLRFFPDFIVVHNAIVKKEAADIYGYPQERIFVSGIPQFDRYVSTSFIEPREEFFKNIGADPAKDLILYAPAGDWMNPCDKETLEEILKWIREGQLPNMQVLLRLHPAYRSRTEELAGDPNLIVDRPGKHFESDLKKVEFDEDDIRHLVSSVAWSAVTINTASTMAIEGAIMDKPVIMLGFDGRERLGYWHSVLRYYDREHMLPIVASGGAPLVKSPQELLAKIQAYRNDPSLDHDGRQRILKEQCHLMDGKAGERIGNFVIEKLR